MLLPFSIIVYIGFIIIWGEFAPTSFKKNLNYKIGAYGHMFTRIQEIKQFKNIDVLFLGSSHSYRGFDTRIFENEGIHCFNLGSSSQTPIQTRLLIDRYLDELNPKVVVIEVSPLILAADGVESSLDIIANDKNDIESIKMCVKLNNIKSYNAFIYGVYRDIFNKNSFFKESKIKGKDEYISGGYVEKEVGFYVQEEITQKPWTPYEYQLKELNEIALILKEKKIPLVLVQAPVTSNLYSSSRVNVFDSTMNLYGNYYNYNKLIELDDSYHFQGLSPPQSIRGKKIQHPNS